jgi:hypothetical protein
MKCKISREDSQTNEAILTISVSITSRISLLFPPPESPLGVFSNVIFYVLFQSKVFSILLL